MAKAAKETKKSEKKTTNKSSKKNIAKAEQKTVQVIEVRKSLKWIYPEECGTPLERKAFRTQARNKLRKLERLIIEGTDSKGNKLTNKKKKEVKRELKEFTSKFINGKYEPAKNYVD